MPTPSTESSRRTLALRAHPLLISAVGFAAASALISSCAEDDGAGDTNASVASTTPTGSSTGPQPPTGGTPTTPMSSTTGPASTSGPTPEPTNMQPTNVPTTPTPQGEAGNDPGPSGGTGAGSGGTPVTGGSGGGGGMGGPATGGMPGGGSAGAPVGGSSGMGTGGGGASGGGDAGGTSGGEFLLTSPGWEEVNNDECTTDEAAMCPLYPEENVSTMIGGTNQSPELNWSGTPDGTQSFVLVLQDLVNSFVHWVVWNIPDDATGLPANLPTDSMLPEPAGAQQGAFFNMPGYFGSGACGNTYEFHLYALSVDAVPEGETADNDAINDWVQSSDAVLGESFVRLRSGEPYCTP